MHDEEKRAMRLNWEDAKAAAPTALLFAALIFCLVFLAGCSVTNIENVNVVSALGPGCKAERGLEGTTEGQGSGDAAPSPLVASGQAAATIGKAFLSKAECTHQP